MSSWTEDRVELLATLWSEGKTAAEIANELGGVTRNAVIGKAYRLKLSGRASPIQQNNKKPVVKRVASSKVATKVKPIKVATVQDNNKKLVPLAEISGHMCRWPVGDPQHEDFGFCGDRTIEGLPYCNEHAKVAYQAATRNRLIKEARLIDDTKAKPQVKRAKAG